MTRAFNINPSDKYSGTCGAQLVTLKVGNKSRVLELQFGMVRQLSFITWRVHGLLLCHLSHTLAVVAVRNLLTSYQQHTDVIYFAPIWGDLPWAV